MFGENTVRINDDEDQRRRTQVERYEALLHIREIRMGKGEVNMEKLFSVIENRILPQLELIMVIIELEIQAL